MGKTPTVGDHGGNNYPARRVSRTRRVKENCSSFRCRDCDTVRYTTPIEWTRAARPRCLRCGGPLLETVASEKRTLGGKRERTLREKEAEQRKRFDADMKQCWGCGERFTSAEALAGHLMNESACVFEYRSDGKVTTHFHGTAFIDSSRLARTSHKPYRVVALNNHMELEEFDRCQRLCDAKDLVRSLESGNIAEE